MPATHPRYQKNLDEEQLRAHINAYNIYLDLTEKKK